MRFVKIGFVLLLLAVLMVSGCSDSGDPEKVSEVADDLGVDVISTSFDDLGDIYCDPEVTQDEIATLIDEEVPRQVYSVDRDRICYY